MSPQEPSASISTTDDKLGEFLAHHGVRGMKWGVRKASKGGKGGSTESSKPAPKKASTPQSPPKVGKSGRIETAPIPKGHVKPHHQMSDDELRRVLARIDMERRYSTLTAPAPAAPSKGQKAAKFVTDILLDVGKQQAKSILTSVATDQVNKQLAKKGLPVQVPKAKKNK